MRLRIIVTVTAEPIFVTIVMLARVEGIVRVVFFNIRFERRVISGPSGLAARFSSTTLLDSAPGDRPT
jgi:hypothetical protein